MAQSSSQRGRKKASSSKSRSRSTTSRAKSSDIVPKKIAKSSRSLWKTVSKNPLFLYGGGTLAVGVLARFAYKYYQSHPEIGEVVRDGFSNVENRLREYRLGANEMESEARH